jgi:hypothetical protein
MKYPASHSRQLQQLSKAQRKQLGQQEVEVAPPGI